jgi:hypothetical protein
MTKAIIDSSAQQTKSMEGQVLIMRTDFIAGACAGSYNGQPTTVKLLRPVLYYFYIITASAPINQANVSFDVDHIIPQEAFEGNSMIDQSFRDCLSRRVGNCQK